MHYHQYTRTCLACQIPGEAGTREEFVQVDANAEKRIAELQDQIEQLKARLPKHSVPAAMIIELEDLEDELQALQSEVEGDQGER
jgi:uncharacterized small protein (DUF1192 family)